MKYSTLVTKSVRNHCCVHGCSSKCSPNSDSALMFHNLPFGQSRDLLLKWITAIKLPSRVFNHLVVCSRHFLPQDYEVNNGSKTLKCDSVPSQNLPRVWRNKFTPRNYGRLIKMIEVRGIGRLRLCFEAKLSRRLRKAQQKRWNLFNGSFNRDCQTVKKNEITMEPNKLLSPSKTIKESLERRISNDSTIEILDHTRNEDHCLTSEIEIKEEPVSEPEEHPDEEESVEEMLAKMNEDSFEDGHVTIVENDKMDVSQWSSAGCEKCGPDGCDGTNHKIYECYPCGKEFRTNRQLNAHNLSHFEFRRGGIFLQKEAICKFCHQVVSVKEISLNEHMATHGRPYEELTCMLCDQVFTDELNLIRHINSHSLHRNNKYSCKLCGAAFGDADNLDLHVQEHRVLTRDFVCRGCGQKFKSKDECWAHLNSHIRAKTLARCGYNCDVCGRVLSTRGTLKEHMFIHSGEKPFECQLCGKKIRHRANLIIHVQGHSLGQPHICHICGLGFAKKSELSSHSAAEHPSDLPFLCTICGMRFRTESRFHKHAVTHDAQLEDEL